jgi:hypothetical protein
MSAVPTYMPSAAGPTVSSTSGTNAKKNEPMIVRRSPNRARSACTILSPPSNGSPPSTTPSAPDLAMRSTSAA